MAKNYSERGKNIEGTRSVDLLTEVILILIELFTVITLLNVAKRPANRSI